ncbi:DJ-1/PfpI family protein [Marinimicrobium agarilyticum]|uniref:DJ-1/PfpI family protein n=1 Tax=Marinimicrobium agarilyticum TaxID=306546 RepID=UPI000400C173|nr:DJ-1/PfpI family protein [Marinimicrobium agarilyticum]
MTRRVGIYLFSHVEILDFAGPYEVFTAATRVHSREHPGDPAPFEVVTLAETLAPVRARAGLVVTPDYTLDDHPPLDILLVPGGVVTDELNNPQLIDWLVRTAADTELTASVCTGAFLLAKAGLLNGKRATTHWEDVEDLRRDFPETQVQENVRWVDEGKLITSGGVAAGIDMSLHIVRRLSGETLAVKTARQIDVPWSA